PAVTALANGNYVVLSPYWNGTRGAATWGSGVAGVSGTISPANSLVGSNPNDYVGTNLNTVGGNYLVLSPSWNGTRGAVTLGNGSAGVSGVVSAANSLVGSSPGDQVGTNVITVGGNYLVRTPTWSGLRGAITWGSGATGVSGEVSAANSLVG